MKLLMPLLLCFTLNSVIGQPTFSKSYDFEQDNEYGTCIKQWGDDMVIYIPAVCKGNTVICYKLLKINQHGEVIWKKTLNYPRVSSSIGIHSLNIVGNNLLVGLTGDDSDLKQYFDLRMFSPDGDSLWSAQIKRERNLILRSLIITDKGNIIWERRFPEQNHKAITASMNYGLPNEQFLITTLFCPLSCGNQGKQLWYMDADGNKIWEKSFEGEPFDNFPSAVGLNNGNFVVSYKRYEWPNTQITAPACVQCLNSSKDSLWEHCFLNTLHVNINSMTKAKNGDIIGCGAKGYDEPGQSGWLFRMTEEGEVLWERSIFYDLDPYTGHWGGNLLGITEDKDGNIWAAGSCYDTFPNHDPWIDSDNAWVLKLSPNGCLLQGCNSEIQLVSDYVSAIKNNIVHSEKNFIRISPNPSFDIFKISPVAGSKIRSWSLYNMMGQEIQNGRSLLSNPIRVNLSACTNGVYLIRLQLENGGLFISKLIKQ